MKSNEDGAADLLPQYFRFLNKKAVDPLCLLLGDLESAKWRRVVCDCLVELCRDEIQPLTKHLSASNSSLFPISSMSLEESGIPAPRNISCIS